MSEAGLEQKYIKETLDTNWVVPLGPNVNAFEQELERFVCSQNVKKKECNNVKIEKQEVRGKKSLLGPGPKVKFYSK